MEYNYRHKECKSENCVVQIVGDKNLINTILRDAKARGLIKSYIVK